MQQLLMQSSAAEPLVELVVQRYAEPNLRLSSAQVVAMFWTTDGLAAATGLPPVPAQLKSFVT